MELKDFKNYLRIDDDLTDDDSMVPFSRLIRLLRLSSALKN